MPNCLIEQRMGGSPVMRRLAFFAPVVLAAVVGVLAYTMLDGLSKP